MDRSYRFPSLQRDLAVIGGAILLVAAAVGAVLAFVFDQIYWRRSR